MKPTAFDSLHPALPLVYFAVALVLAMAAPHPTLLALSFAIAAVELLRGRLHGRFPYSPLSLR